ncbi:MAG: hypothetical protein Q9217_005392 [Psora testacea]
MVQREGQKELRERSDRLRERDSARSHARTVKAAKGDKRAQAAIQRANGRMRAQYHAVRRRAAMGDKVTQAQLDKERNRKGMAKDRRRQALLESRDVSEKFNSAQRIESQRLLRLGDLLAEISFERSRHRRKVKLEIRPPFEDKVNISKMALKSPESLIAIADASKEAFDMNNLDLKAWMEGMGGGG